MNRTLVHFEIPADDPNRLAEFYNRLFGWTVRKEERPMPYWSLETAPPGQGVNGGMYRRKSETHRPVNYFWVESVDEFSARVQTLGGEILVPKSLLPSLGYFAIARDPEGNVFGLWEENPATLLVDYTESG